MKVITTEITIAAPIEKVWAVLTDFKAYPEWNPFLQEIQGDLQVGATLRVSIAPPQQKPMIFRPTVLAVIPQQEFRWRGCVLFPSLFAGEHIFMLNQSANNMTQLIHKENFSGILHKPVMKKIAVSTEAGFIAMNQALKQRCEAIVLS